nr:hypothetical protein [Paramuribaculum sp.]
MFDNQQITPPLNFSTFNSTTSLNIEHNNDNASFANKFKIFIRDVFVYDKKIKNPKRIEFIDLAKALNLKTNQTQR